MDEEIDISNLSKEELEDEYFKLKRKYEQLHDISEKDAQQIHDLKRNLATAVAAEAFLASELEQLTFTSEQLQSSNEFKIQNELDELRRKHHQLHQDFTTLQQDFAATSEEMLEMRKEMEQLRNVESNCNPNAMNISVELEQRIVELERENLDLLEKFENYHEEGIRFTMTLAERDRNITILKDQLSCLKENMRAKCDELEERTQLLESTQEQLTEANARIAMMTTAPESNDRKGNSLFAEVDDQRQAMKLLLAAQKKSYMQMKKIYNESEYEVRRLKRENLAMQTELQTCSSIFCNADRTYRNKLYEQIRYLTNQNDELQKKMKWTQERLKELADSKGVLCIDTIFNFCKLETDDLKKQLHSSWIQKANLEQQLRNVTQDMARWRFESLKSRCILIDRENLLNEHHIAFKQNNAVEFSINEQELNDARPRIVKATSPVLDKNIPVVTLVNNDVIKIDELKSEMSDDSLKILRTLKGHHLNSSAQQISHDTEINFHSENKENVQISSQTKVFTPTKKVKEELLSPTLVTEIPLSIKSFANELKEDELTPAHVQILPGPSILSKSQKFTKENEKNVKFAQSDPVIHKLSPNHSLVDTTHNEKEGIPTIKQYRTKSNVLVRRITIKPNQDNLNQS